MLRQPTSYRDTVAPPIPVHLGAFLKMLRDRHGIAQSEVLGHLPGWQQSAYSKVEKDARSPVFEQLVPIYRALAQAGVQMTLQDRQQFVLLARRKIESMKTRHERKSDADWDELREALADIDRLPETTAPRPFTHSARSRSPLKRETGHLVGREAWLDSLAESIKGEPLVKVIVVQGPPGSGKTSELYRIAERFLQCIPRYHVVLCEPPPIDQEVIGPDIALEVLLQDILDVVGSPLASLPPDGLQARVKYVLESLARGDRPVLLLFDHAEQALNEQGDLAPLWKQFLSHFTHTRLDASLVLASREWPAWIALETQHILHTMIPPLSQSEGRQVLQRLGLQEVAERQLDSVVEAVAGIPLCLEWVTRLVQEPLLQDGWAAFEEKEDGEIASSERASTQSLAHLLEDASLFGGPVAARVTSLLERVIKRLSPDASLALRELAISTIPLAGPALKALYRDPSPLKELRDASLLVAYPRRVQLLPMVAAQVRGLLAQEEVSAAEDRLIRALTVWLDGIATPGEQGRVVTELALLLLKHLRLLDAAELLIELGWLSSGYGNGARLARTAFEVMGDFDWRAQPETECGGILLRYYLGRFRGEKTSLRGRAEEYQQILTRAAAQQVPLKLATVAHLVQHIANHLITQGEFSQAHELLDSYLARIDAEPGTEQVDMLAPLLKTRAHALNAQGEREEEQGNRDTATRLKEEALRVDLQCVELLRGCEGVVPHRKQSTVRYHLARTLNEVGYFLVNLKRGEEALKALEESIDLKRQGYVQAGSMAMTVGEAGQALKLVGRFQEALRCNEQALEETQQFAASGHATAQGDVSVHLVDRARLLLRVGNLQEAERLVNDALPHIRDSRSVYRDRAQEVLKEIADCRAAARDLGREFLDWRWYARYKTAIAFDVFGWLTHAGPFSPAEQEEWSRLCDRQDEQAQTRREQIIKASRDRELENALGEQREPHLLYPALRIEEMRTHTAVLRKLAAEISEQEPNAIVRRLYLEAIEEQVDYLLMVEATYRGDSQSFWEHNRRVHAEPTPEEMEATLGLFLDLIQRGMQQENTAEISAGLLQDLQRVCDPDVLVRLQKSKVQEGRDEPPSPASGRAGDQRLVSPPIAKQFFEAVLRKYGFSGWRIQLDHATNNFRIESNVQTLFLPAYKPLTLARVRELLGHELEFHVLRAEAGKASSFALLAEGTRNFLTIDEGMAVYFDQQTAQTQNQVLDVASVMTWIGTLATGLAAGVLSTPQTFLHLQQLLECLYLLDRLLSKREGDLGKATAAAHRLALNRCLRTYRGVPDLTAAGICYAKDAIYLRGYLQLQRAVKEDPGVLDRLMVGKIAYEHLRDMEELGITIPSIRPRWYAQRPDLDEYTLSFDASPAEQDV